jgi:SNF2 family DNA or RNA helicase
MGIKPSYYKDQTNLKELAKNYLIKRTKEQVGIQLPELRVNNIQVEWENEKEKALAEALHNKLQFSGVNLDESSEGVRNLPDMNGSHFAKLMRSRQICILPEMVADGMPTIYDKEKLAYITEGLSSWSKVNAVVNHIAERKDNGRKKLMFCHFRHEMTRFEEELTALGLNVEILDGRTPQKERERILISKDIDVHSVFADLIKTGRFDGSIKEFATQYRKENISQYQLAQKIAWAMTDQLVSMAEAVFLPLFQSSSGRF